MTPEVEEIKEKIINILMQLDTCLSEVSGKKMGRLASNAMLGHTSEKGLVSQIKDSHYSVKKITDSIKNGQKY